MTTNPWDFGLITDRLPAAPAAYARVELDPGSQRAVFYDSAGGVVEMAKHGTSRSYGTTSVSGGGDGARPAPQTNDDNNTDYDSD